MRSDGAGEYTSKSFLDWCAASGIVKEKTLPYEHHQNGIAKRLNRTMGDMARKMLIASGLPDCMWPLAYLTAAHLHNCIPNSNTNHKTPVELLFAQKPHLGDVRTFGERAYVHVPEEKRQKLAAHAFKGHFVGYIPGSKGRKFWDPAQDIITQSSMAVFLSDGPPVVEKTSPP